MLPAALSTSVRQWDRQFASGIVNSVSLVSTTNTARSLAGCVSLALALTRWIWPGSSEKFFWFAGPSVTFADSTYMNSWFGVNAAQAAASKYPQYDASAGLKSAGFGITMILFVDKHWFVTADGALKRLLGSAAHSPITQTKTDGVCDVSINYQF